jgi:DNA-binding transcriptional MerR regulator
VDYTIGQLARLARVSVRTLRHYDRIGLLHPSAHSQAGYRLYSSQDLERLQRILCYRQLGFSLRQIKALLSAPATDPLADLQQQRTLLCQRIASLQRMLEAVDKLLKARSMGIMLEPDEMLAVFGEDDPVAFSEEAQQRWEETAAWAEAKRRAASFSRADWQAMQAEFSALMRDLAAASAQGVPAASAQARRLAEAHRLYIERWVYPCSAHLHCRLADLYVSDARFTESFQRFAPQLAQYLRTAIYANAGYMSARERGDDR